MTPLCAPGNLSLSQVTDKPVVQGRGGLVAAQHRRAAEVGAAVLRDGGNAVDAAVATSFALGVLEPWMSGLGGGGYMLIGRGTGGPVEVIDFGMWAPRGLEPTDYPIVCDQPSGDLFPWPAVLEDRNVVGPLSVAVPTLTAGMALAAQRFGTRPWAVLLGPAIDLAEAGLSVDWWTQLILASAASELARDDGARTIYLAPDGFPHRVGWTAQAEQRMDLGALPQTLRRLAADGAGALYGGLVGRALVADMAVVGGRLTLEDLEAVTPSLGQALAIPYQNHQVWSVPTLSGGPSLAATLRGFTRQGLNGRSAPDASSYTGIVAAMLPVLNRRLKVMGDVDGHRGLSTTTHFCVVDADGLAVACTQTLVSLFGSKVLSPETGILLNNGISWFDPVPGGPNTLAPGKRCLSNMCPALVQGPDGNLIALGASGGRKIMPAVAQLLSFLLDNGMDLHDAWTQPRLDIQAGGTVIADTRIPEAMLAALPANLSVVRAPRSVYPNLFANPTGLLRHPNGQAFGMTDSLNPWGDAIAV